MVVYLVTCVASVLAMSCSAMQVSVAYQIVELIIFNENIKLLVAAHNINAKSSSALRL